MYVSEEEFPVEYRYNPHEEWHYGPGITDAPIPEWRDIMWYFRLIYIVKLMGF